MRMGYGGPRQPAPYKAPKTTAGPYDYLRKQVPKDKDPGDWEKFIDLLNRDYERSGRDPKLLKRSLNELIAYGNSKGAFPTPGLKKKADIAAKVSHATAQNIADQRQRLEKADTTRANADAADKAGLAKLTGQFENLNEQDQNALANYLSATDPMMAEIFARTSDPADIQRQLDAYAEQKGVADKYKSLTDPTVTAQERYMSELARRQFEAADRSNRAAVSEQMANRGLRSGGQEIAANQSMQQQLAQDRLLKELGIQKGAVDRSMTAMEGWNSATANLGIQSNAIRDANDSQRQFEDEFKAKEAERRSKLAGERRTATTDTTTRVGGRDYDIYDAGVQTGIRATGRADQGLSQGGTVGSNAVAGVIQSGGIEADVLTDEEETRMGNPF